MEIEKLWFENWFDSKYYHILYKDRSEEEAKAFINKLLDHLKPVEHARMLDLACGKGRHAKYLASIGYDVTGLDLSPQNIEFAKQFETDNLHFEVHNMLDLYEPEYFQYIFNLFTSFGYFEGEEDNIQVIHHIDEMLTDEGVCVIDFMNAEKEIETIVSQESKQVDGIDFHITRKYDGWSINKKINFEDQGEMYEFEERVQALTFENFDRYLKATYMDIKEVFGDYQLNSFDKATSDRLIIVAGK